MKKIISYILITSIIVSTIQIMVSADAVSSDEILYGDISGDAVIDLVDYSMLLQICKGELIPDSRQEIVSDLNGDNIIDDKDANILVDYIQGGPNPYIVASGFWGELRWILYGTLDLVISGSGDIEEVNNCWWVQEANTITVNDGITGIGDYAFYGCLNLTCITLPLGIISIGTGAFEGCNKLTIYCFSGIVEEYAIANNITYELILNNMIQADIKVYANENAINNGYTVLWYNTESNEPIASGNILRGCEYGEEYVVEISLDEELGCIYKEPQRQTLVPTEENSSFETTLVPFGEVTVSGTVTDENENPIANAKIKLEQTFNNKYSKNETVTTDGNGNFSKSIKNAPTKAVISSDGYYSKTKTVISTEVTENELSINTVSLAKLPENKIVLTMRKTTATKPGDMAVNSPILSANNLNFTLFNNTRNRKIEKFVVQYPNIILGDDEADGGDVIKIDVTDNKNTMTSDGCYVELDKQKIGSAAINFIENGKFTVNSIMGNESNTLMIFDESGKFIKSEIVNLSYISDTLVNGNYFLVFIKKTDLLRSAANISKLNELGLSAGTDYIVKEISIENGEITEIDSVTVPQFDESKLYYTVSENTKFVSNYTSAAQGRYITMRCEYEIDEKYSSSNETVKIELPENVSFAEGSLTLDGKITPYTLSDNVLTVNTNSAKAVIRFYVVSTDKGEYRLNAYLSFANGENSVVQPIGTAIFTAEASKISLPKKTGQKKITVTGTTLSKSKITLYDNNTEVGATTANANGTWSVNVELVNPISYSYHNIYAKIENDRFGDKAIKTDTETLIYDKDYIELSKITMINTAHTGSSLDSYEYVSVFDFITPSPVVPSYWFWPGQYPKFTFKVEFTGGDDRALSDVYVVTTNSSGDKTYVKCDYDSKTGMWLGTQDYSSADNAPVSVNAIYKNNLSLATDMTAEELRAIQPLNYNNIDGVSLFDIQLGDFLYHVKEYPIDVKPDEIPGNIEDYTDYSEYGEGYTDIDVKYNSILNSYIVSDKERYMIIEGDNPNRRALRATITRAGLGLNGVSARDIAQRVRDMLNALENNECGNMVISPEWARLTRANLRNRGIYQGAYSIFAAWNTVNTITDGDITGIGDVVDSYDDLSDFANANFTELLRVYNELKNNGNCNPGDDDPDEPDTTPPPTQPLPVKPVLDPSGYVYEAVPSNRVEGVKAEAYYYDYALDDFGIPEENKSEILWDAENYDQVNPLYTDKNGMYAWDVPMGQWLVRFSKDGYIDTDSKNDVAADSEGYLPVPPPQTEVNTAIISKASPVVKDVNVYNDEVQIIFSQYMQIDTVNTANVTVNCGGKIISGTITPSNAEDNYDKTTQYASIFVFKPNTGISGNTTITIQNVRNYAGKDMVQKYVQTQKAEIKPESISVSSNIDVKYNSGALLEIQILPKEAGAGKKMTAHSSSPSIVDVVNSQITADENGKATVMLSGNLPGEGEITVALDGTPIKATTMASVGNIEEKTNVCEKVTASIANGSVVEKGTKVTLSTSTEGAEIYYTLDGTCPCVTDSTSRIKYTAPIEINEYTFIIAYAVKEGFNDSNTAGFVYDIKAETKKAAKPSANPSSGKVSSNTTVTLTTETENATIFYTTDGSTPTQNSTVYIAPVSISSALTIKAIAIKDGMENSDVMTESYTVSNSSGNSGGGSGGGSYSQPKIPDQNNKDENKDNTQTQISSFNDVNKNDWYYEYVKQAFEKGLMKGISETEFAPNEKLTRAMFVTILYRMAGEPEAASSAFSDIEKESWYEKAVCWANENGIVQGVSENKFAPNENITREQMSVIIYRYAKYKNANTENISESTAITSHNDIFDVSDWATEGMNYCIAAGIIGGDENGNLLPKNTATRAETATVITRISF